MRDFLVRMKTGRGHKTYVWFIPEHDEYYIQWLDPQGNCYDDQFADANTAAYYMFNEQWDGNGEWPVKFYIRRAKAGIAIIDHAKEHGL